MGPGLRAVPEPAPEALYRTRADGRRVLLEAGETLALAQRRVAAAAERHSSANITSMDVAVPEVDVKGST